MSESAIFAIKDIASYKLPSSSNSVPIDSAAFLSLLAEPIRGGLVPSSAFKAKLQQTGPLRSLLWVSGLKVVSLCLSGTLNGWYFLEFEGALPEIWRRATCISPYLRYYSHR